MTSIYAQATPLAVRQQQCQRIAAKHGDGMLPIVLQAVGKNTKVSFTALPADATVADLISTIREVGDVSKKSACALQVAGCTPSLTTSIGDLYAACRDAHDGFLYVSYAGEKTMGCAYIGGGDSGSGSSQPTVIPGDSGSSSGGGTGITDGTGGVDLGQLGN